MVNVKEVTIMQDGNFKRVSATYDELSADGKIVGTNNRFSRVLTDEETIKHFEALSNFVRNQIEEG